MGTHPSNPSKALGMGQTLQQLVTANEALLGSAVAARYNHTLPFLFKVLSINKALSIQAHPDKALAERLHAADPQSYPDANHKPEMTIAITPFDGFCGFRPIAQIRSFVAHTPALRALVGEPTATAFIAAVDATADEAAHKAALKALFAGIMRAPAPAVAAQTAALVAAAEADPAGFAGREHGGPVLAALVRRLHADFPGDIGLFCALVLNYITLQPGEAVFLRANDPHAYLSGDVIECMAASDNVVRAGLTPKFKDVDNLVEMLTYSCAPIEAQKMAPERWAKAEAVTEVSLEISMYLVPYSVTVMYSAASAPKMSCSLAAGTAWISLAVVRPF